MTIDINELGKNYERDAVAFALENQELRGQQIQSMKQIVDLSDSVINLLFAFDTLTREGGWDTLEEKHRQVLLEYRDKARKVVWGEKNQ